MSLTDFVNLIPGEELTEKLNMAGAVFLLVHPFILGGLACAVDGAYKAYNSLREYLGTKKS
jgi:hypothetical protein